MPLAPSFPIADSSYTIQLRPLTTHADDRAQGKSHYALCLWMNRDGLRYEICGLSGFVIPSEWSQDEQPARELLVKARELLLADQDWWSARVKIEQRILQPSHVRWLAHPEMRDDLDQALAQMIERA